MNYEAEIKIWVDAEDEYEAQTLLQGALDNLMGGDIKEYAIHDINKEKV